MHPLEADVTLLDGRVIRVTGGLAVLWKNIGEEHREKYLISLAEWVDERKSR